MRAALLVSAEGLVVASAASGGREVDVTAVSALIVDVAAAGRRFGSGVAAGELQSMLIELQDFTVIRVPFRADAMLVLVADPGVIRTPFGESTLRGDNLRSEGQEEASS
ncbi:MAG: roadblock/LC7 domain-containing protein [Thermoleophilia bacterium]|nr:roadblock/LC7 domain-containing protein [Thermoleophilia bacterium]